MGNETSQENNQTTNTNQTQNANGSTIFNKPVLINNKGNNNTNNLGTFIIQDQNTNTETRADIKSDSKGGSTSLSFNPMDN
jgi:hypothetical protein